MGDTTYAHVYGAGSTLGDVTRLMQGQAADAAAAPGSADAAASEVDAAASSQSVHARAEARAARIVHASVRQIVACVQFAR
jgi:hypothetical protein